MEQPKPIEKPDNDGLLQISVGHNRFTKEWKLKKILWSDLLQKLAQTTRTRETHAQYQRMTKDEQGRIKDVGGFIGGVLKGGRRKSGQTAWRSLITLDADFAPKDLWGTIELLFGNAVAMYSTHSHSPERPKLRLVIPLARQVTPDEYEAVSRFVAAEIGIDYFDDTTYQPERLMYWPSTSEDGEYLFEHMDGPWLDPDAILSKYPDWQDVSTWPESSRATKQRQKHADKQGDPREKPGIVGAFCRAYDIPAAIETFLPEVYEPCDTPGRYTYTGGSASAGLVVYDGDQFAYSHHGTDPAGGLLCNSFDLVRIHKYALRDEDAKDDTPINKLPSYQEMAKFALEDPEVRIELAEGRTASAREDFEGDTPEDENAWKAHLTYSDKGGIQQTIDNALLILSHDPGLKDALAKDEFARREMIRRSLPWREIEKPVAWCDADDASLRHYLERYYGLRGRDIINDALSVLMDANRYHPIREYLDRLTWDGVRRLDTMLVDYLGADPTDAEEYTREIGRKWMIGGVARVMEPGCKFDTMLVLVGAQGVGKSQFFARLAKRPEWFSDSLSKFDNSKDASEQLAGKWIIEVAELSAMRRSEVDHVKAFLAKSADDYRPSYGRRLEHYPRQCIFAGTTNRDDFLQDVTGGRRFWPVKVEDTTRLWAELTPEVVDQLWAEAATYYLLGESRMLSKTAEEQAREKQDEYTELGGKIGIAAEFLERKLPAKWEEMSISDRLDWLNGYDFGEAPGGEVTRQQISGLELFVECFGNRKEDYKRADAYEMTDILSKLGWQKAPKLAYRGEYGRQRIFLPPGCAE